MKRFILILIVLGFALPVFASENSFLTKALKSWLGYSINEFMDAWGYPDNQIPVAGKNLYYWSLRDSTSTNYYHTTSMSTNQRFFCEVVIEVDSDYIITGTQWKGNNCPFSYTLNKELVNPKNNPWVLEKQMKKQLKNQK